MIAENRVTITAVTKSKISGSVQGSRETPYRVEVFKNGKWNCECDYYSGDKKKIIECSHALAIKLLPVYKKWILDILDDDGNEHTQ